MKRIWNLALGTAVLCAALLCGCTFNGSTAPAGSAPADPLTGQELQYPGERVAAVVIDNAPASTFTGGCSAGRRCCPSSGAQASLPATIWTTITSGP